MCVNEISEVNAYYFPGKYTTDVRECNYLNYSNNKNFQGCLRSCYQDASKEECGCYDPRYPSPEGAATCTLEQSK